MQREVPEEINIQACKLAKKYNVLSVLDIGGADIPLTNELLSLLDIISPNTTELKRISGKEINTEDEKELISVIRELRQKSNNPNLEILLKLGSKGAMFIDKKDSIFRQNAFKFDDLPIVDTTGAGDCFTASFSMKFVEKESIENCMKFGSACAYLCIGSFGAMPSLPTMKEFNEKMKNRID